MYCCSEVDIYIFRYNDKVVIIHTIIIENIERGIINNSDEKKKTKKER